ncbi:ferredoxin [Nonomuraea jabiensis]|uniref:ferredoxin n=1 Tax=Nonomuraea jabiensis TaxID=882448 RepID=UPI003D73BB3E
MRTEADQDRCVGAAQCVLTEPALFDQDEGSGTVVLLSTEVDGDLLAAAQEARRVLRQRRQHAHGVDHPGLATSAIVLCSASYTGELLRSGSWVGERRWTAGARSPQRGRAGPERRPKRG